MFKKEEGVFMAHNIREEWRLLWRLLYDYEGGKNGGC